MSLASTIPGLTAFGRAFSAQLLSLAKSELQASELYSEFQRSTGQRVPFSVFERNYNTISIASKQWDNLKYVGRENVIRSNYIPSRTNFPDKYRTVIRVRYATSMTDQLGNITTGEETRYVSVMHTDQLTRGELEDIAEQRIMQQSIMSKEYPDIQEILESRPVMAFENTRFTVDDLSF